MATFQFKSGFTTDPETGCIRGYNDYEQCRTTYFLKQQNEILQQQTQSNLRQENTELKSQLDQMRKEIEALKTQQTVSQPAAQNNGNVLAASVSGMSIPTLLLAILVVAAAAFLIGQKFYRKQ